MPDYRARNSPIQPLGKSVWQNVYQKEDSIEVV